MKNTIQFFASAMAAALLLHSADAIPVSTSAELANTSLPIEAETVQNIVVLGDSISTGAGLAEGEKSYVTLVQEQTGAEIQNFAQDTYTTTDVLHCLEDAAIQAAVADADVILISVGMHDMFDAYLEKANALMTVYGFDTLSEALAVDVESYGFHSETDVVNVLSGIMDTEEIKQTRDATAEHIQELYIKLNALNQNHAKIIFQTAYNVLDLPENYAELSPERQALYAECSAKVTEVMEKAIYHELEIWELIADCCMTADICTAFQGNAWQYTNIDTLDFNPNAAGHALIAEEIIDVINSLKTGDVDGDNLISAKDASAVLIHAANVGAGNGGTLDEAQLLAADVDGENSANASDASYILIRAAYTGAGKTYVLPVDGAGKDLSDIPENIPSEAAVVDADPNQPEDPTEPPAEETTEETTSDAQIVDADPTAPNF